MDRSAAVATSAARAGCRGLLGLGVACVATAALAADPASAPRTEDTESIFSLAFENDIFASTDRHYTNGIRLSYLSSETLLPQEARAAARALPMMPKQGFARAGIALGQSMYTPEDITREQPDPRDRPYAGWLYASFGLVVQSGTPESGFTLGVLAFDLGVVGPASLADKTQKFVHKNITNSQDPKGWGAQLGNEPGFILSYQHKWRWPLDPTSKGFNADVSPYVGASLGNVLTQASGGAMVRVGYNMPSDFGPSRIRPSQTGSDYFVPAPGVGVYLFAGVEGRAVARNIFLDGNTFDDSPRVDKQLFVGDLQLGVAMTYGALRITYTQALASREFENQPNGDGFGAFTVALRVPFE